MNDGFVYFALSLHLVADLPADGMEHKEEVYHSDADQLSEDEVGGVKSFLWVSHRRREANQEHSNQEDKTLIQKLKSHVMLVHEWSQFEDYKHCEEGKIQVDDELEVLPIGKIDNS